MKMIRHSVLSVAAVVSIVACEQQQVEVVEQIRPVRYITVNVTGGEQSRTFSGVTKAALETDLSFKVSGLLTGLNANVGDIAEKGDLVASIEPTDFRVGLREAEAGLERAKAEERNAQAVFERTRELYENRNASRSELDTARATAESAAAQVRAIQQQQEAVRLQLSYTKLSSPQRCQIAKRYVEINQNVVAGQPVVRLNCGDCPEIRVDVPGIYIGKVQSGAEVSVEVPALPDQQLRGVVTEVGIGTDQNRSIYPVTVKLQDGCDQVLSGMAADVTMSLTVRSAATEQLIALPMVSVGEDREGNFVFVLEPAGADEPGIYVARRRSVEIGIPESAAMPILSGIELGEKVATAGVRRLTDGQRVSLLAANPATQD